LKYLCVGRIDSINKKYLFRLKKKKKRLENDPLYRGRFWRGLDHAKKVDDLMWLYLPGAFSATFCVEVSLSSFFGCVSDSHIQRPL
jgi:hypothetical protein